MFINNIYFIKFYKINMNKIKYLENQILEIREKINFYEDLEINQNSKLLLLLKIEDKLNDINDIIDEFDINNINLFKVNKELSNKIKDNIEMKKVIDIFGPLILSYQLNRNAY